MAKLLSYDSYSAISSCPATNWHMASFLSHLSSLREAGVVHSTLQDKLMLLQDTAYRSNFSYKHNGWKQESSLHIWKDVEQKLQGKESGWSSKRTSPRAFKGITGTLQEGKQAALHRSPSTSLERHIYPSAHSIDCLWVLKDKNTTCFCMWNQAQTCSPF